MRSVGTPTASPVNPALGPRRTRAASPEPGLVESWVQMVDPPAPERAPEGEGSLAAAAARHDMAAPRPSTSTPFGPHSFRAETGHHPKTARFLSELTQLGISREVVAIVASDLRPAENEKALMRAVEARFSPSEVKQVRRALEVARPAHAGQTQKRKKEKEGLDHIPYFNHCLQVARMALDLGGSAHMVQASLLHDVVEDTPVGMADLRRDFAPPVLDMVRDVTRGEEESRPDYLDRVSRLGVASSSLKALDRLHNLVRSFSTRDPAYLSRYLDETTKVYRPKMEKPELAPLRPLFEKLLGEMKRLRETLEGAAPPRG